MNSLKQKRSQMMFTQIFRQTEIQENPNVLLGGYFSLSEGGDESAYLRLVPGRLLLLPNEGKMLQENISTAVTIQDKCWVLDISFEVKFEVTPFSIKIFLEKDTKVTLLSSDLQKIKKWNLALSRVLNQVGFHELFKPLVKLDRGNFAAVYEVERKADGKKFAVKAFSKQSAFAVRNGKESLINEIEVMRRIPHHSNILRLDSVFESDNSIYVVLEMLSGGQLMQKITQGKLNKNQVRQLMRGLLSGISHLHSNRMMHRDLKPQNIMLRSKETCEAVIVDFGLAAFCDAESYLFYRCGTPGYVAPEIIALDENKHIEPQCDVFSIGSVFHLLLTEKALFEGTTYSEVYSKNKTMHFNLNSPAYKAIDPIAMDLLAKMLHIDANARISPAQALKHSYFNPVLQNADIPIAVIAPKLNKTNQTLKKSRKKPSIF